jgi:hypothetical protein
VYGLEKRLVLARRAARSGRRLPDGELGTPGGTNSEALHDKFGEPRGGGGVSAGHAAALVSLNAVRLVRLDARFRPP